MNTVYDRARMLARLEGDEELLTFALDNFRQHVPKLLADVQAAARQGQERDLHRHLHSLAGSSAAIAADPLFQAARQLETLAGEGRTGEVEQGLPALQALVQRFLDESAA